ncbi:MAG: DnaD domain protein [Clostridiales bacterium]|nr:DnaD domain protein [Clostridiales bacterium]MCF8022812.1 DnaD domain protein [Clostridiales bacterium]
MAKCKPWFKMYSEIKNDRKMKKLNPEEKWLWVVLLCVASDSPDRGSLLVCRSLSYTAEDLADEAALDISVVQEAMPKFEAMDMLHTENGTWVVTNFLERQYEKPSDQPQNSRARKQAQRERQKNENATRNVTPVSRACHAPEKETETDKDKDYVVSSSNRAREIQKALQSAGILAPSPFEVQKLQYWLGQGIEIDTVKMAAEKAALAGKHRVDYIDGTLRNWHKAGYKTAGEVRSALAWRKKEKVKGAGDNEKAKDSGGISEFIISC